MRFEGTLKTWNDERGFGFIAATQGGDDIFVHISAMPHGRRPTIGEPLSFEIDLNKDGKKRAVIHPVLDGRNRPILAPTAFDINTSIQRCLVKAIALHGLGLYIYAGEDLPQIGTDPAANDGTPESTSTPKPAPTTVVPLGKLISPVQQRTIRKLADEVGVELARVVEYFGVKDVAEFAAADYLRVVRSLEKRRAA